MKIYTYYTESHKQLFDEWFSKTITDLEIEPTFGDQECPTGSYYQDGWKKTTMKKVDVFINAVNQNLGGVFVFSDVDIQFFGPIKEQLLLELGDADIAIQNDYKGGLCSGFFVCRGNERTLRMFENMKRNESQYPEDQYALNMNLHFCNVKVLSERFWTFGAHGTQWKGQNFDIPDNLLMHHSNWTEGIQNKIRLLEIVREKNNRKQYVKNCNMDYQSFLNEYFSEFRPIPTYPTYPPYHTGKYMEQYFFDFFNTQKMEKDIYYIPVDWTTCYIQNENLPLLQEKILSLDKNKRYFTISQHDDAIKEYLPNGTMKFCAGGNAGGIPIPLVCSPIPKEMIPYNPKKDIFCSFVGSLTHPIRQLMNQTLVSNPKYKIITKPWTDKVSESDMKRFTDVTSRSIFTLCPRGYGKNSFRMYEAMQLGSIPVYIYDDDWRAFKDDLNWDEFSVSVHYSNIGQLDSILSKISKEKTKLMSEKCIETYNNRFSLDALSKKIISLF